ncbi:MAG: CmpA/NrtA family ABC transporter substrate-binding protein [Pseudomonadota bacterium]
MTTQIRAGFLPLIDAAILIAAREMGFAEEHGIDLSLVRETSWANVRDRLAVGHFDAAHILAPMPIAANLGLTAIGQTLIVPMALGLGGNAITVSNDLHASLGSPPQGQPAESAEALARYIESHRETRLRFAVVHPFSAHNIELRYWLAAGGISPDQDVDIVVLPPALVPDALAARTIEGYCVGEPWNTVAVLAGTGKILTTKSAIWASSPEKVLAVSDQIARTDMDLVHRIIRALTQSAQWCAASDNADALAELLSRADYLAKAKGDIISALLGPAAYEPFHGAATFPWQSHALWLYSQMVRWQMAEHSAENAELAASTYRPDIYRSALAATDVPVPTANAKVEGALQSSAHVGAKSGGQDSALLMGPDGFFDNRKFDPDRLEDYLRAQSNSSPSADLHI